MHGYLLLPNPFKTNLFAGRLGTIYYDIMKDVDCAVDRPIDTELIRLTMSDDNGLKSKLAKKMSSMAQKKAVGDIISWIEKRDKAKEEMAFCGAPFLLHSVIERLREEGRSFDVGVRGLVLTGGGWKVHEMKRMPEAEFRQEIKDVLGIPAENVIDMYGMVEGNGWMVQCRKDTTSTYRRHTSIRWCWTITTISWGTARTGGSRSWTAPCTVTRASS